MPVAVVDFTPPAERIETGDVSVRELAQRVDAENQITLYYDFDLDAGILEVADQRQGTKSFVQVPSDQAWDAYLHPYTPKGVPIMVPDN